MSSAEQDSCPTCEEELAIVHAVVPLLRAGLPYAHDQVPPALRGPSSSFRPNRTLVEDEREARSLVPLVRAAADEVPVGAVPHLPIEETNTSPFLRWDNQAHQEIGVKMDEFIAALISDMPSPPRPMPVFMTQRQFDLLKQHAPPPSPYDLGVIAPLFGVPVVVTPERTRWQRLRARLRRWRWWR